MLPEGIDPLVRSEGAVNAEATCDPVAIYKKDNVNRHGRLTRMIKLTSYLMEYEVGGLVTSLIRGALPHLFNN